MLLGVLLGALFPVVAARPVGAQDPDEPKSLEELESERERIATERAVAAASIDALEAEESSVVNAIGDLRADLVLQEAKLGDARAQVASATDQVRIAQEVEAKLAGRAEEIKAQLSGLGVKAYVDGEQATNSVSTDADGSDQTSARRAYLGLIVGDVLDLSDELKGIRSDAAAASRDRQEAAAEAERLEAEIEQRLSDVSEAQDRREVFLEQVSDRLDHRLVEAASLAEIDSELSDQIAETEAVIAYALAVEQSRAAAADDARARAAAEAQAAQLRAAEQAAENQASSGTSAPASPAEGAPPSAAAPATSPPATQPQAPVSVTVTGSGEIRRVGPFQVHESIADNVSRLLAAASADGINLSGGGYRSPERQVQLRRQNCGSSSYAIYEMSSSRCRPPTARPGRSNHERGLALDLRCNGGSMSTRGNVCFSWMAANAANFGLYNLPSEPWHWSVNGR